MTTVDVTGGIGLNLKNWKNHMMKKEFSFDDNGEPVLMQKFSVDTGTLFTINTKTKKTLFW